MKQALYGISERDSQRYQDLAEFFDRIGEEDQQLAEEAQRLLAQRIAEK